MRKVTSKTVVLSQDHARHRRSYASDLACCRYGMEFSHSLLKFCDSQWAFGSVHGCTANRRRASRRPSATLCGMPLTGVIIMKRSSPVSGRATVTLQGRSSE